MDVQAQDFSIFAPLFAALDKRPADKRVLVAVDGGSASGKTTLSRRLAALYGCTVFHMDDFFLQPVQRTPARYVEAGGNVDRERFLAEVLEPLARGEDVRFRRFDCATMSLGEETLVHPTPLVVVEGVYAMHPAFEKYYDFSVFLDIAPALQRERILRRHPAPAARRFFAEWIPLEDVYFEETNIAARCDMTIHIL